MNILHICSDYPNQAIYKNLLSELGLKGISQTVYIPVRDESLVGKNQVENLPNLNFKYALILRSIHRIMFGLKVKTVCDHLKEVIDVSKFDLIHAHFLLSDGEVARRLSVEFGIPFITAVRNTDINTFFTYKPHLRFNASKIIKKAKSVIFLSPSYLQKAKDKFIPGISHNDIESKAKVIPNGIPDMWFENTPRKAPPIQSPPLKLLFVGEFSRNKNLRSIIEVCSDLNSEIKVELTLVGGGGDDYDYILKLINSPENSFCKYVGKVAESDKLIEIYLRNDIFVMPSFAESFGLVYIEAISQGLPIIYTKGEGIDGYFAPNEVGIAVNPHNKSEIKSAIKQIYSNLSSYQVESVQKIAKFNWSEISDTYLNLYTSLIHPSE